MQFEKCRGASLAVLVAAVTAGCSDGSPPVRGERSSEARDSAALRVLHPASCRRGGQRFTTILRTDGSAGSEVRAVAMDDEGATWVAGRLAGPGTLGDLALTPSGSADAFVARLDPCGRVLWAGTIGGSGDDAAIDLDLGADGTAIVVGSFQGTIDLGDGPVAATGQGRDHFVVQLGHGGDAGWSRILRAVEGGADVTSVATDSLGSVFVLGVMEGVAEIDDVTVSTGVVRAFLFRLDAAGDVGWGRILPTRTDWEPLEVEVAPGGVFVAGDDVRGVGIFAMAVTGAGEPVWTRSFRVARQFDELLGDMTVDDDGLPVLVGTGFLGRVAEPLGKPPRFVAKLGDGGEPVWIATSDRPIDHVADPGDGLIGAGTSCERDTLEPTCDVLLVRIVDDGERLRRRAVVRHAIATALDRERGAVVAGVAQEGFRAPGRREEVEAGDLWIARLWR